MAESAFLLTGTSELHVNAQTETLVSDAVRTLLRNRLATVGCSCRSDAHFLVSGLHRYIHFGEDLHRRRNLVSFSLVRKLLV